VDAEKHARGLDHWFIGPEHLLLATVATSTPAGAALQDHGLTPERVRDEIGRRIGHDTRPGAGLFGGIDRQALAAIGIDLDAVHNAIEDTFGTEALLRAEIAFRSGYDHARARAGRSGRRRRQALIMLKFAFRRRHPRKITSRVRLTGRDPGQASRKTGHIPFTPRAKRLLELALREALARRDRYVGPEHIALALTEIKGGLAPEILFTLGGPAPMLRAAILDRYRKAS
jgi:ATP-dependent Clp protease ATP-binding subunit ClpA